MITTHMEPEWITEKNEISEAQLVACLHRDLEKSHQKIKELKATIRFLRGQLSNKNDSIRRWWPHKSKNNSNK